ncbi:hypothetical protein BN80_218 [Yersinia phage phiR1-RT]|uniref:Uncharacterized protein n=1 Tax=Yersinia phage phiR1-RT TaxID=1206558 RepID=I7J3Z6_BPPR1|nr:hypothetical protein BN80_218 [Yersinia phage phiR1-RT]CCI88788.1 hypothetical protein BN80_218 [Yersinia phage phiR1-RT]
MIDLMKPESRPIFEGSIANYVVSRLKSLGINAINTEVPILSVETATGPVCLEMISRQTNDLNYAIQTIFDLNPTLVFIRDVCQHSDGNFIISFQYIRINYELIS